MPNVQWLGILGWFGWSFAGAVVACRQFLAAMVDDWACATKTRAIVDRESRSLTLFTY